jgi:sugar (pentulose or hexulose) kinase
MTGRTGDERVLLAVDVGTGGARAVAVDLQGRVVAEMRQPYQTQEPHPGWAEQNPQDWSDCAAQALTSLARRLGRRHKPVAIGLTGQCPTVAPFDAKGRPVGPGLLYRDNRAVDEAREMRERLGIEAMHRRTGHVAEAFHVGPKVLWLRRHQPDVFGRTARFLQPRDVVLRRLCGRDATDETNANATLFFDLRARRWAPDVFASFDLAPTLFPDALAPWTVAGELAASNEFGLPAGVPIIIGSADSQCAAFGAGVVDPGPVSDMAGSSSCLNSAVLQPLADLRVTHYSHVVPNRFSTEMGVNTAGAAIDWAVTRLGYRTHAALAADATRFRAEWEKLGTRVADPGEAAPLFLPYLGDGERDDPTLRAAFIGLSSRHDRRALAYAVLEGVAFAVWSTLVILQEAGSPLDELRVSGGGGRLSLLSQLKADVLGRPVIDLRHDATAIGAAMLAGTACGLQTEARAAIEAVVREGRRLDPTPWGREVVAARASWFERTIREPGVHVGGGGAVPAASASGGGRT